MLHVSLLLLLLMINSHSLIMTHEGPKHVAGKSYNACVGLCTIILAWIFTCIFSVCFNTDTLREIVSM